jgi:acetyl-CoA carboxylase biotin carboxyl carrier protein
VPLDAKELRDILLTLNQTDITELTLKTDDMELTVRRGPLGGAPISSVVALAPGAAAIPEAAPAISAPPPTTEKRYVEVMSPMVGTFYRAPGPDESPFAEVGDRIRVGQTVCIIEAMKLMNELESEVAGEVIEILLENGQPVEYGQPLMRVIPS